MRVTDKTGVPSTDQVWRLPLGSRILIIAGLALVPLFVLGFIVLPAASGPGPVSWGVLAVTVLVWAALTRRTWLASVTLTADALVIRNVLTTRTVPLADITGVTLGRNFLRVTAAGAHAPTGIRRGGPTRDAIAVPTSGSYWTGRRTGADAIAHTIAAAAGLPPLAPSKERLSQRRARLLLAAGLVCAGLGLFFGPLGVADGIPHALGFAAIILWPGGAMLLFQGTQATIAHRRTRNPLPVTRYQLE